MPPASRLFSWFVSSVIVGWVIAYNVLRIAGRSPRGAAWTSLVIGVGIGLVIFGIVVLIWRRWVASGRLRPHHLEEIPPPERLDARQRSALDLLWPAVAALSLVAVVVGIVMAIDWWGTDGERSVTKIILAAWNVLVGAWLALESAELKRFHGEAVESIALAAMLTSVLAGVALSQNMFEPAQIGLIVVAGVVGAVSHFAGWRILGSRGLPWGVAAAIVVATLAIVLPVVL